ncbi:MAG: hypothetical protein GWN88_11290, partial [Nitrospinaceae bacterium]|nr:hypothetical protein [Nitrospinaceae bacterium]NIU44699.1 hypothetical protein [Nitrospinaceae bacterium]NIU96866.1 hypothetical protein [Nitrospinaceae bacterium]NIW59451.1 hypothetical protein [Nitrospinaceae bacterium]
MGGVVSACTIQPKPVDTSETLVTKEAPIFDKRFEKVSAEELSLKNFWTPGKSLDARSPIPIQSNTFAEITGM